MPQARPQGSCYTFRMADGIRTRNRFDPDSTEIFPLSRTKLQLFLDCPRCFYLDRRLGINRPDGPPFTLNVAVDALLKREFDEYRAKSEPHPIMEKFGVEAVPFNDPRMDAWRDNRRGVRVPYRNVLDVFGAVDDVWVTDKGALIVVDYKATGVDKPATLDDEWKANYKRQMEVYQWLLRGVGETVEPLGYFLYASAQKSHSALDAVLKFTMTLLPYEGNDDWVNPALDAVIDCLQADAAPPPTNNCEWCAYRRAANAVTDQR